jgi:protein tyrosine phosphatase
MSNSIQPGDRFIPSQPKKMSENKPLDKTSSAGLEQIQSFAKRSKLTQTPKQYDNYKLYNPSSVKHSSNFDNLFKTLTDRTRNELLNQFKDEDFCEVSNRFPPKATGTRCIRNSHIGEASGRPNKVHANHVKLLDLSPSVICSQAPKPDMEEAFWTQVILHSSLIVDLTNDKDRDFHGVHDYFPEEPIGRLLGSVRLEVESTDLKLGEVKYKAMLEGNETKEVERLHFAKWPDAGVISVEALENLLNRIEEKQAKSPLESLWIHCRAGVGRTGTVTVALAIRQLHREGAITSDNYLDVINELILKGRAQRDVFFVQSKDQYQLLLKYAEKLLG